MTVAPASPYKGLNAFEDSELDALLFFGREREREVVVANLIASRLTVLYGPSGVGKSSLLRASVARSLRELPEQPLVVVLSRWTDDPAAALAAAVASASGSATNGSPVDVVARAQDGRDVYLVLDQAEEYFLYHADDAGTGSFAETLPLLLEAPWRVNVLVSLREDSLAKLDRFTGRIPGLFANTLRLDRLDREAGRAAILRPVERFAELTGRAVQVDPRLAEQVLDEVGTGQIEPALGGLGAVEAEGDGTRIEAPYLQLVMQRLWEEEQSRGSDALGVATLERLGGAQHIVEEHLEGAVAELTPEQKDIAGRLFNHLVTPSGTKIGHEVSDLADFGEVPLDELRPVLDTLTERRILRSLEEAGDVRYEIFHDVLAQPVLAWRAGHEAERQLAEQKRAADRRQRRLLALVAVGAVLLAIMTGVTAYALSQRAEAEEQAASAQVARSDAELQAARAESEEAQAERARQAAQASAEVARQAEREAEAQRARAESERAQAETAEARAEDQAEIAEQEAARAQEAEDAANESREEAEREASNAATQKAAAERARDSAEQARENAQRAARDANARALAEQALTLQSTRPVHALRLALESAERDATRLAERVLRTSLVASRVRHVLPGGGGPVVDASFSGDARRVVTVADRARVFDARSGSLVRELRHAGGVASAEFSPDGTTVVTAGVDGMVRLWPVPSGAPRVLDGHRRRVEHATFSADGRWVASAGTDRTAMLWSAAGGDRVATFEHEGPVFHVEISPDGSRVLTVSRVARTGRRIARLFDAHSGAPIRTYDQIGITTAVFSPDGSFVVTTSTDDTARVWYESEPRARAVLLHPDGDVHSAVFSSDGTRLVTATEGSSAVVWHVGTWQKEVGVVGPLNPATYASFSPNRVYMVVASRDRNAHIFHADNGRRVAVLAGHGEGISVASFSPTGRQLVTASADGSARIWDPGTEDLLDVVGATTEEAIRRVAPSPDGRLAVSAGADGRARILDVARRRQLALLRHEDAVNDAGFSPDGTLVLTASDDGSARLWRRGWELVRQLPHGSRVLRAVFSRDGALIATGADDRVVRVWRTRDGRLVRVLRGHTGAVLDVAFSPDGAHVASAGDTADRTARIWETRSARVRVLRHRGPVVRVAFSPDGRLLATASGDEMARLWDARTGKLRHTLRGHSLFVRDVDFRRDGAILVTASDDGDARTWSVATGKTIHVLRGHFSGVQTARFSPDGRWIVTAGPRTAGLWDADTAEFFAPTGLTDPFLRGPTRGPVTSAAFMRDGLRIVTSSGDGTVRTFLCSVCGRVDQLARLARSRLAELQRGLSAAERLRYLRN